jgi:RNA polymerase sigma factor (sigma-70 family)
MAFRDKDIIESIRKGENTRILKHLYEKILPKIRRYICKNSGTEDDAFDVFQDGVVIFYRHVMSGNYRDDYDIAGFLYTVCRNLWINKVKHERYLLRMEENYEGKELSDNILDNIISEERASEVRNFLKELGERCRELLQYVFYYQLTTREICDRMGFANEDTLKTKKYKCKQRLLEIINKSKN